MMSRFYRQTGGDKRGGSISTKTMFVPPAIGQNETRYCWKMLAHGVGGSIESLEKLIRARNQLAPQREPGNSPSSLPWVGYGGM